MAFAVTTDFSSGTTAVSSEVNQNFEDVEDVFNGNADSYVQVPSLVPIGSVVGWLKTFASADSGTTDGVATNKLIQSGQNFTTTVLVGMIVYNTTDSTFANVTAVDSDTQLTLDADIMVSGENYTIYKTPKLADGWIECDGSTVSDADSPYNGVAVPNLNSAVEETYGRFLRGADTSGNTESSQLKAHTHTITMKGSEGDANYVQSSDGVSGGGTGTTNSTGGTEGRPVSYTVVWIIRIK